MFIPKSQYYLLFTYPNQKQVHVLHGVDDKVITAEEGNQALLVTMAQKLVDDNIIDNFRVVKEDASQKDATARIRW